MLNGKMMFLGLVGLVSLSASTSFAQTKNGLSVSSYGLLEDMHPGYLVGADLRLKDAQGRGLQISGDKGQSDAPLSSLQGSFLVWQHQLSSNTSILAGAHAERVHLADAILQTSSPEIQLIHGTT